MALQTEASGSGSPPVPTSAMATTPRTPTALVVFAIIPLVVVLAIVAFSVITFSIVAVVAVVAVVALAVVTFAIVTFAFAMTMAVTAFRGLGRAGGLSAVFVALVENNRVVAQRGQAFPINL